MYIHISPCIWNISYDDRKVLLYIKKKIDIYRYVEKKFPKSKTTSNLGPGVKKTKIRKKLKISGHNKRIKQNKISISPRKIYIHMYIQTLDVCGEKENEKYGEDKIKFKIKTK